MFYEKENSRMEYIVLQTRIIHTGSRSFEKPIIRDPANLLQNPTTNHREKPRHYFDNYKYKYIRYTYYFSLSFSLTATKRKMKKKN